MESQRPSQLSERPQLTERSFKEHEHQQRLQKDQSKPADTSVKSKSETQTRPDAAEVETVNEKSEVEAKLVNPHMESQQDGQPEAQATNEPEKPKTIKEQLDKAKDELKNLRKEVNELKKKKGKTEDEKNNLRVLQKDLLNKKVKTAELQRKVDSAKTNSIIRRERKELENLNQEDIKKVLEANELNTESDVKYLISLHSIAREYGVKKSSQLKSCLEYIKTNAPHLLK